MNRRNTLYWIFILFFPFTAAFSQETAAFRVQFNETDVSEVLSHIEDVFDVRFSYQDALFTDTVVTLVDGDYTLDELLTELELSLQIRFQRIDERYISVYAATSDFADIQQLNDVIVTSYLTQGIYKRKDGTFTLRPNELGALPGLTESDVLESIQLLPGVISPNETATGFNVRGGRADQNRILWDGINIYHKGHLFGMISAFNPNRIEDVQFQNKGTHPRYGERLSSVVSISSGRNISDRFSGGIGINGVGADAYLDVPILKEKLDVQAGIRRSYDELFQSFTFDRMADKVFESTKITNSENTNNDFFFQDYTIKLNYRPNDRHRVHLSTIQIDNDLDYVVRDTDNGSLLNDLLEISNEGYGLQWHAQWDDRMRQEVVASISKYRFTYNLLEFEDSEQVSDFEKKNVIFDSGVSTEFFFETSDAQEYSLGYQYSLKDVSYAFLETAQLSFVLDSDQTVERTHSLFGNYDYRNPKLFDVAIGVRVNYFQNLDDFRIEPRIFIYKDVFKNVRLQVSGEVRSQIISEIDETVLSDLSLENRLWRLADGNTFPIIKSHQVSAGMVYNNKGWTLDADAYYKKIDGLTALALGFLNPLDSQFHIGEQKIVGADFYIKKDFSSFNTWFSYSINQVRSKYRELNNDDYFTASNSIRHNVTASVTYRLKGFEVALGWNWHTGRPFTEAITIPSTDELYFQKINTKRLPNYHRLDISSTYTFRFSKTSPLRGKMGFSIRNLYDKRNYLSREYFGNNNINDPVTVVDRFSLGFTPNFLLRLYW
ncbi:MAG: TonB-dependent receptor [Flavobacteriaceae bacterium]|nr:TonB-dependent receptor [Flavobacteriaceae bacterium]